MADEELSYDQIIAILEQANKEEAKELARKRKFNPFAVLPVVFSLIAFAITIVVWFVVDRANPVPYGTDWAWLRFFGGQPPINVVWPRRPVNIAYVLLIVSMILCTASFIINFISFKFRGGRLSISVFLIGAITITTLVSFLMQFLPMGILG